LEAIACCGAAGEVRRPAWQASRPREFLSPEAYEAPMDPFVDIELGDLVVHVLHGVSRFRGIKAMENKEQKKEDHFGAGVCRKKCSLCSDA